MTKFAPMAQSIHLLEHMQSGRIEAGCDEAGRGPLAGPVVAAAVILPEGFYHPLLNDSKKMSRAHREIVREYIEKEALSYSVVEVSAAEIDTLNILWASVEGMQRAVLNLSVKPEMILVDGNRFRAMPGYEYTTVVHGDATYASIAAASVLAKTYRDEKMEELAKLYPGYGWERNMGYPTEEHIAALKALGPTPEHRRSFHPKALEPSLFD